MPFGFIPTKRQQTLILLQRRRTRNLRASPHHENMPDNLCLLLNAVAPERPPRFERIIIAAKGMPPQHEVHPRLMLPDMGHFVDKQALRVQVRVAEIVAIEGPAGVKMDAAARGHHGLLWLEKGPFVVGDLHLCIIYRIAKNRMREVDLGWSERADGHVFALSGCRNHDLFTRLWHGQLFVKAHNFASCIAVWAGAGHHRDGFRAKIDNPIHRDERAGIICRF